jgi:hypothetical protein
LNPDFVEKAGKGNSYAGKMQAETVLEHYFID